MQWFKEAKLGIFIHWGIYAVNGIPESWSFYNGEISYNDYMKQLDGFTASKYDPTAWASLFKEAGAKYAVLTSKHHDGVALWDTKLSKLNVADSTPAKRDLIGPFVKALREKDLRIGFYFSHLDWSHPDYASIRYSSDDTREDLNSFAFPPVGKEDPARWENFLAFHRGQLKELGSRYKPDIFWFDGDWDRTVEQWRFKELRRQLHEWVPGVILNARMKGYGDYKTPEQGVPVIQPDGPWELCLTINDSWGYQGHDQNYKSTRQLLRIFTEVIGMGGNLLLDVGPKEDGTIPKPQEERLREIGKWIKKHEEAVYPTVAGLPLGHFYGPTTLSKDKKTIFLYQYDIPRDKIYLKGVRNKIKQIRVVGQEGNIAYTRNGGAHWVNIPGVLLIDVPQNMLDEYTTVIAVELEGELDLYHAAGEAVEVN
ncbi:alpha-L-fucosidase [Pontibacter korlensis]|uniref:alpha-L-fucosidase n=2 Tax=Pontibacter korlensis TaxID=400092 RepID=A0A0E3ZIZ5_9BACT|nr:alpha-L-fucosidase [Pontibacter korlensis]